MPFTAGATGLDDMLDTTASPPRPKRSLTGFLLAFDRGNTDGFHLDDYEGTNRLYLARCFGLTFPDGSPYPPPDDTASGTSLAYTPDRQQPPRPEGTSPV